MLIFFYDMSDQTEIALDQNMTGLIVTVCTASQKLGFLFWSMVRVVIQNFLKKPVISTVFKADE